MKHIFSISEETSLDYDHKRKDGFSTNVRSLNLNGESIFKLVEHLEWDADSNIKDEFLKEISAMHKNLGKLIKELRRLK